MKNYKPSADMMPEPEAPKTFTTSRGIEISLKPISQFKLDALRMSKAEIPVPTYTVKTVGGDEQELVLDAASAESRGRLDEWNAYLANKKDADTEYSKKFLELTIWEGTNIEVPNGDSEWHATNEHFGIKVPDNPIERKLFYVYNELLGVPADLGDLMSGIFAVSQIDEEAVQALRDSFRAYLQRKTNRPVSSAQRKVESTQPDL